MYKYLEVKDSDSLTAYYKSEQEYRDLLDGLNRKVTDNPIQILEKNIRSMSESYLAITDETVQAKRGLNVEKYKSSYESALRLYKFINDDISILNGQQPCGDDDDDKGHCDPVDQPGAHGQAGWPGEFPCEGDPHKDQG